MTDRFLNSVDGSDANSGADWSNEKLTLATGIAGIDAAGDRILINSAHTESAASISYTAPGTAASPNQLLSVTPTGASGVSALTAGATFTSTGASGHVWNGSFYAYGLTLVYSSASSGALYCCVTTTPGVQIWDACTFKHTGAGSASTFGFGSTNTSGGSFVRLINPVFETGATSQRIVYCSDVEIIGGSWSASGTDPTAVFISSGGAVLGRGAKLTVSGFDFTNLPSTVNLHGATCGGSVAVFKNCKLPASWSGAPISTTDAANSPGARVEMYNCDNADTNYRLWIRDSRGDIKHSTSIYNDAGASDGTTRISWEMVTTANVAYPASSLTSPNIVKWNETTGSALTATVEIVHNSQGTGTSGAVLDSEVWLEIEYLGTSGIPLALFASDSPTNVITTAADQTTSAASWTGDAAGWDTQKLSVTFTPQEKGFIIARVHVAKASATIYVDPLLTVA